MLAAPEPVARFRVGQRLDAQRGDFIVMRLNSRILRDFKRMGQAKSQ